MNKAIPSATVLLLRDGKQGLEVFMVLRPQDMSAFGGVWVFPGGKVDAADYSLEFTDAGFDSQQTAARIAAVREVYEECGVLLARHQGSNELLVQSPPYQPGVSLLQFCQQQKLELALEQLHGFGRWITPENQPKIFDTWFFLAALPKGQQALHDGSEAVDSMWIRPRTAIEWAEAGKIKLIFPTRMSLLRLAAARSVAEALMQVDSREPVAIQPTMQRCDDGQIVMLPENTVYPQRVWVSQAGKWFKILK